MHRSGSMRSNAEKKGKRYLKLGQNNNSTKGSKPGYRQVGPFTLPKK
jgi:hypothetical protein